MEMDIQNESLSESQIGDQNQNSNNNIQMDEQNHISNQKKQEKKVKVDQRKQKAKQKIFTQMMFYMSEVNLMTDGYLRNMLQQKKDGFIPVNIFISFKAISEIFNQYKLDMSHQAKHRLFFQALKNKKRYFTYNQRKAQVKRNKIFVQNNIKNKFLYFELEKQIAKEQLQKILNELSSNINQQLNNMESNINYSNTFNCSSNNNDNNNNHQPKNKINNVKKIKSKNRKQPLFQFKMINKQKFGFICSKYISQFRRKLQEDERIKFSKIMNYEQWLAKKKQYQRIMKKIVGKSKNLNQNNSNHSIKR